MSPLVFAHAGAALLAPHDLWTAWSLEPGVLIGMTLTALIYAAGVRALWRRAGRGRGVARWQVAAFAGGLAGVLVALVSPVDALGGALFSGHMLQHLILTLVAAPLLALGDIPFAALWALPPAGRRRIVGWWHRSPVGSAARAGWARLSHPVTVWVAYVLALWVWHLPVLYQATLRSDLVHTAQHLSFLGTAYLLWWCVAELARQRRHGTAIVLLFLTMMQGMALGVIIASARTVIYPAYAPRAAPWGVAPLADQQLAGLLMWMPPGLFYLAGAAVLLVAWLRAAERRATLRESGLDLAAPVPGLAGRRVRAVRHLSTVAALALGGATLTGCADHGRRPTQQVPGGDPSRGPQLVQAYGCETCHVIPGVEGARGRVGPPLAGFAELRLVGGAFPNTPDNVIRWIMNPQALRPGSGMPYLGVSERDARDLAAYLYTLR